MGNTNSNLHNSKSKKNDEFYTQYADIQRELNHYEQHFKGKVVLCNADDPFESNFCKFFLRNFNYLGLKRLICTSYNDSPVAGTQLSLFDIIDGTTEEGHGYVLDVAKVPMANGRGVSDADIDKLLRSKKWVKELKGNGDFRSDECIEYLKQADIVVTNPPFSLFRDYVAQLIQYGKKFIIIGSQNAITYKEIFPLIGDNQLWLGYGFSKGDSYFKIPERAKEAYINKSHYDETTGLVHFRNCVWFTNLDHNKRHEKLILYKHYSPEEYPYYDNYDAINVDKVADIPTDYDGIMGVPLTFMDKYNPQQFEILGATQRGCHDKVPDTKKYDDFWEVRQDGSRTGSSGGKTNENANLRGNDGKKNYFINAEGYVIQSAYQRIFIRRKDVE